MIRLPMTLRQPLPVQTPRPVIHMIAALCALLVLMIAIAGVACARGPRAVAPPIKMEVPTDDHSRGPFLVQGVELATQPSDYARYVHSVGMGWQQ